MARKPQIDRPAIVSAALAVADEHGLDGLTMQRVADRLGVSAMALYRHVENKADLRDAIVEGLLTEVELPPPTAEWSARLTAIADDLRATARRHPAVFPLLLERPAVTPSALRVRHATLDALRAAGLDEEQATRAERRISTILLGYLASEAGGRLSRHPAEEVDDDFRYLDALVQRLIREAAA